MDKELSSTLENYLEAIFRIEKKKRAARVRDISQHVGVSKSTVSAALKSLASKKLIEYEPYELIVPGGTIVAPVSCKSLYTS